MTILTYNKRHEHVKRSVFQVELEYMHGDSDFFDNEFAYFNLSESEFIEWLKEFHKVARLINDIRTGKRPTQRIETDIVELKFDRTDFSGEYYTDIGISHVIWYDDSGEAFDVLFDERDLE